MSLAKRLFDFLTKKTKASEGGGEEAVKKQIAMGKMTARDRINAILDDGSFHEWAGIPELTVETGDPGEQPVLSATKPQPVSPPPAAAPAPKPAPPAVRSADAKPAGKTEAPAAVTPATVQPAVQNPAGRVPISIPPVSPDVAAPAAAMRWLG